jgi:hypothetical protein
MGKGWRYEFYMVECLLCKLKALCSNPSVPPKKTYLAKDFLGVLQKKNSK